MAHITQANRNVMSPQNGKQRLRMILEHQAVDRPAFVCPGGMMNMAVNEVMAASCASWPEAHTSAEAMAELVMATAELGGVENLGAPFCMTIEAEALGAAVDLGSRETEPRVTEYAIERLADCDRLIPTTNTDRAEVAADAIRALVSARPDLPVIANLTGPISLATSLIEPLVFYRAMRRDASGAHALLELATAATIAFGDRLIDAGADTVCIADPSGTGELIGGRAFEQFALPYNNRMVSHFAEQNVPTIVHICGDVKTLGATLGKLAAPAISIDSNVSFEVLRQSAPEHAAMGNVSTYLLEYGKPETLRQVAERCLREGVDIISPACGIGPRTPVANIRAVADVVRTAAEVQPEARATA